MGEHLVQAYALGGEHIHPEPQGGQRREKLGPEEVGQGEGAVRRTQEQRPALVGVGDRLAREVIEGHQPGGVRGARQGRREERLEHLGRVGVGTEQGGELAEHPGPGVELAGAVVAVHHGYQIAGGGGHQVEFAVDAAELVLEHDHGEDAGPGADVAGPGRDRVGRDHPGPGVALGRRHRGAGLQSTGRIEPLRTLGAQRAGRLAGSPDRREQRGQVELDPGLGAQLGEPGQHGLVVVAGGHIDREHPAGVADAEHPFAAELPVHVAGEGGQVGDRPDMLLLVEHGLVQVGDAPAVRDVVAERGAQLLRRGAGAGVAPGPERGQQGVVGAEREIPVHHRRDPERADRGQLHPVLAPDVRGEPGVAVLESAPDGVERIGPGAVDELVLPSVTAHGDRLVVGSGQHGLDPGGTQFDPQGGPAGLDGGSGGGRRLAVTHGGDLSAVRVTPMTPSPRPAGPTEPAFPGPVDRERPFRPRGRSLDLHLPTGDATTPATSVMVAGADSVWFRVRAGRLPLIGRPGGAPADPQISDDGWPRRWLPLIGHRRGVSSSRDWWAERACPAPPDWTHTPDSADLLWCELLPPGSSPAGSFPLPGW